MSNTIANVKSVFTAALGFASDAERNAYLTGICGDDAKLRAEVESLLKAHDQAAGFLSYALPELKATVSIEASGDGQLTQIGPYKLIDQIGQGGMGTVYLAQQKQPVRRTVALKVIKRGMDSEQVVARFEAERQALALMNHPNIARVLDAGMTEDGRPYFVMDLVRGVPITEYCEQHRLNRRERLELFVTVCRAVQHAHLKGIIHRDLKPSNILVELHDVSHVPKIIDFGVAKATSQQLTERTLVTHFSQMIGTPLYMSPEQAELSGLDVDTRSDVYSLGVLLYEMLTGTPPFDAQKFQRVSLDEMRRIIREEEPQRPSQRISTLNAQAASTEANRHRSTKRILRHHDDREIDWIVMKSLEKDRTRRYESASALAQDVERYLDDEPVQACPPSLAYRLRKLASKYRGLLTTAMLLVAMLITSTIVSAMFAVQAGEAQRKSDENLIVAVEAINKLLEQVSNPELQDIPRARPILKKILNDSIKFYEQIRFDSEVPPETRYHAVQIRLNLANLSDSFDEKSLTIEMLNTASDEVQDLVDEFPDEVKFIRARAEVLACSPNPGPCVMRV